jgi:hypothetical protein
MKIADLLLLDTALRKCPLLTEVNPLTEDDVLQEAQVLDVRFDALSGVVGVLFELRQALQLQGSNTGVLIARGVRELTWTGSRRPAPLTAWSIGSSVPSSPDQLFGLSLVMWPHPGAKLTLIAESAAFVVGDVLGLPEAPPDYTEGNRDAIASHIAGWNSLFEPVAAAFLDPAPLS